MELKRVFRTDSIDLTTDAAKLCPKCKTKLEKGPDGMMKCPECGEEMEEDKKDKADSIVRYDALWSLSPTDLQEAEYLGYVKKFTKDSNGFLRGVAPVTNIGVFSYLNEDGTIRRELRLPEEVFNQDSLASLKMVPLTNDHPAKGVSPDTAKKLQIGSIGDGIMTDAYKVYAPIAITDSETIAMVEDGKRALSCGYTCDLEKKSGVWMGVNYDYIQRNIRYNHVAVVDKGRAGDAAIMKLDSAFQNQMFRVDQTFTSNKETKMKKITIDSVEVEVHDSVAAHLDRLQAKLDEADKKAKSDIATIQAKADANAEQVSQLQAKLDAMPAQIEAAVKSRADLAIKATSHGITVDAGMSESAIKQAIVLKAFPKADTEKLKDSNYLAAMLDSAELVLSSGKQDAAPSQAALGSINQDTAPKVDGCGKSKEQYEMNMGMKKKPESK